jgi:hypothetical protein
MLIVREANYLMETWKVTGTDIKKPTLMIDIFYVSLNGYLFVNKGKIFDSQVSWWPIGAKCWCDVSDFSVTVPAASHDDPLAPNADVTSEISVWQSQQYPRWALPINHQTKKCSDLGPALSNHWNYDRPLSHPLKLRQNRSATVTAITSSFHLFIALIHHVRTHYHRRAATNSSRFWSTVASNLALM